MSLNWALLKNPLNWITVAAMILIAALAIHLISKRIAAEPAQP